MDKEMQERIQRMALRTWDHIGGDCLRALEEFSDKSVMSKDEVLECVCDAGYMKMYGDDAEAYEKWSSLPDYDAKLNAIKPAFPYERYGW